jgi:hypothetical protein
MTFGGENDVYLHSRNAPSLGGIGTGTRYISARQKTRVAANMQDPAEGEAAVAKKKRVEIFNFGKKKYLIKKIK